jgi:hypothetical protein
LAAVIVNEAVWLCYAVVGKTAVFHQGVGSHFFSFPNTGGRGVSIPTLSAGGLINDVGPLARSYL